MTRGKRYWDTKTSKKYKNTKVCRMSNISEGGDELDGIEMGDPTTSSRKVRMRQRLVQSQGRIDIPNDQLMEILGVNEGDSVHLIPDQENGTIRIIPSSRVDELLDEALE